MKKIGILNAKLSEIIASMGHTDQLVICDSGLPIPKDALKVDLALTSNIPRFIDTLKVVLEELQVEKAFIAVEMHKMSNGIYDEVIKLLPGVKIEEISHDKFKDIAKSSEGVAFVRTGEATPFANIILTSGVTFE